MLINKINHANNTKIAINCLYEPRPPHGCGQDEREPAT